jgi:hypothetical protein
MAISYTNVTYDTILDSLHTLISDEFNVPLYYDEHKGNQSFLVTLVDNTLIGFLSDGQARNYSIDINYQLISGGNYTKNSVERITEIVERLKRLIHDNTAYSPSNTYKWHDGRIESVLYSNEDDLLNAVLQFNCTVTE